MRKHKISRRRRPFPARRASCIRIIRARLLCPRPSTCRRTHSYTTPRRRRKRAHEFRPEGCDLSERAHRDTTTVPLFFVFNPSNHALSLYPLRSLSLSVHCILSHSLSLFISVSLPPTTRVVHNDNNKTKIGVLYRVHTVSSASGHSPTTELLYTQNTTAASVRRRVETSLCVCVLILHNSRPQCRIDRTITKTNVIIRSALYGICLRRRHYIRSVLVDLLTDLFILRRDRWMYSGVVRR